MKNKNTIHSATLFFILWWVVAILSWVGSVYSWPGVKSLLSSEALRWLLRYTEESVMSSPFLYGVIIMFIGGGLFVHSGLKSVLVRLLKRDRALSGKERKSLLVSAIVALAYLSAFAVLLWGPWNIVRGVTGRFDDSPLHDGALFVMSLGIGTVSLAYAFSADYYRHDTDIVKGMSYLFSKYSSYFVSLFFVIQFMSAFHYTGFYRILGLTDVAFDVVYCICCIAPLFCRQIKVS